MILAWASPFNAAFSLQGRIIEHSQAYQYLSDWLLAVRALVTSFSN